MRFSLRLKLTLVSLLLLAIPIIGFRFSTLLKSSLLDSREETLMYTARAVAAALANRGDLFDRELFHSLDQNRDLYLFHLSNAIRLNGKSDDWHPELAQANDFGREHILFSTVPYNPSSFRFRHLVGKRGKYLYALFLVWDDNIVYRAKNSLRLDRSDHLEIGIEDLEGQLHQYILTTEKPGWVNGYLVQEKAGHLVSVRNETRIQGVWAETMDGYMVELRIPLSFLGRKLAFAVADIDDAGSGIIATLIGTANPDRVDEMGWLLAPSTAIEEILATVGRPQSRIRVIDKNRRVRARFGTIESHSTEPSAPRNSREKIMRFLARVLAPVYRLFTEPFSADFIDSAKPLTALDIQGLEEGLDGKSSITRYTIADGQVEIMAAITPLVENGEVMGAVVVEQTTNSILALKNRVVEESITFTVFAFFFGGLGILLFASRVSSRIRRLRDQAAGAISEDGQILDSVKRLRARDEIGDLSRTLVSMLDQLREQGSYREKMADNLEHEMRTPLAGVSASLKNLGKELGHQPQQVQKYLDWALSDVQRLEGLLTQIRDATTLTKALDNDFFEQFDLAEGITLWLRHGWQPAFPEVKIIYEKPDAALQVSGDPDRIRQMLDKLIENAVSFHLPETAIEISLIPVKDMVDIQISNQGPTIDLEQQGQIFTSMVSIRPQKETIPHLGLGLFIVRTIVEHHGGAIRVANLSNGRQGVMFTVSLPLDR